MSDINPGAFWLPKQLELISSVKKHPILYKDDPMITDPADLAAAWEIVSKETSIPQDGCKISWTKMKWNYFKLHQLMKDDKVQQSAIEQNPRARKYLDGSLDFLSGLLVAEADDEESTKICKRLEKMFRIKNQATFEMVKLWLKDVDMSNVAAIPPPQADKSEQAPSTEVAQTSEQSKGPSLHAPWQIVLYEQKDRSSSPGKQRSMSDGLMGVSSDSDTEDDAVYFN